MFENYVFRSRPCGNLTDPINVTEEGFSDHKYLYLVIYRLYGLVYVLCCSGEHTVILNIIPNFTTSTGYLG